MEQSNTAPRWLKPTCDFGPLVIFFAAYKFGDLMTATGALMVATLLAIGATYFYERRLPMMPMITAGLVIVFGGLTLWLQDPSFIKIKPTIVNALFSAVLIGGLVFKKPLLKYVLGQVLPLTETGWRKLSLRWALFFAMTAVLNEAVWRTQSEEFWVNFKVFGLIGLAIAFALAQVPMMNRYRLAEAKD